MELANHNTDFKRQNEKKTATFVLHIRFRKNKSWQGSIEWLEKKQTLYFRSALELIKIIDSTNEQGYQVEVLDTYKDQKVVEK